MLHAADGCPYGVGPEDVLVHMRFDRDKESSTQKWLTFILQSITCIALLLHLEDGKTLVDILPPALKHTSKIMVPGDTKVE